MTAPPARPKSPLATHPITSAAIAILMIAVIFFVLFTPLYARTTPKVGNWPFFYFYLLIYMPITSLVLWVVMMLQRRITRPAEGEANR